MCSSASSRWLARASSPVLPTTTPPASGPTRRPARSTATARSGRPLLMLPMMSAVQYICGKIGLVNGRGLAGVLREHYPRWVLYPAVGAGLVANTVNVGGGHRRGRRGAQPPPPGPDPRPTSCPSASASWRCRSSARTGSSTRVFKWLCPGAPRLHRGGAACPTRTSATWSAARSSRPSSSIRRTSASWWRCSARPSRRTSSSGRPARRWRSKRSAWAGAAVAATGRLEQGAPLRRCWDTMAGMTLSEIVAYFIILATGATLFTTARPTIASATDAGPGPATRRRRRATLLLAVALDRRGRAGDARSSPARPPTRSPRRSAGGPASTRKSVARPQFYAVIVAATLIGMVINFVGIDPIDALVLTAVLNGLLAPPLLVLVMLVSNDRRSWASAPTAACSTSWAGRRPA